MAKVKKKRTGQFVSQSQWRECFAAKRSYCRRWARASRPFKSLPKGGTARGRATNRG